MNLQKTKRLLQWQAEEWSTSIPHSLREKKHFLNGSAFFLCFDDLSVGL